MPISLTKLTVLPHNRLDRKLDKLAGEARQLGVWGDLAQDNVLCYAETLSLSGEVHSALVLHEGFPVELFPPYVLSQHLSALAPGLVGFTHNPLEVGNEAIASLRMDAGGRARVEAPLSALEEWEERVERWM